jgi:hypothetical protein
MFRIELHFVGSSSPVSEVLVQCRKFRSIETSYTVSEIPLDLIVANNFAGFFRYAYSPPSRYHQDPFIL